MDKLISGGKTLFQFIRYTIFAYILFLTLVGQAAADATNITIETANQRFCYIALSGHEIYGLNLPGSTEEQISEIRELLSRIVGEPANEGAKTILAELELKFDDESDVPLLLSILKEIDRRKLYGFKLWSDFSNPSIYRRDLNLLVADMTKVVP